MLIESMARYIARFGFLLITESTPAAPATARTTGKPPGRRYLGYFFSSAPSTAAPPRVPKMTVARTLRVIAVDIRPF